MTYQKFLELVKKLLLLIAIFAFALPLLATQADEADEETYQTAEQSSLLFYQLFPLDARYATEQDWQDFYFLSKEQIQKLTSANIQKKADLQKIRINPAIKEKLLPYLTFTSGSIYFLSRLIDQQKYHHITSYLHHSEKLFATYKNSRLGVLIQKDAGETDHNDYQNWFFQQKNLPYFSNIIAGSYQMRLGQGIVFGNRLSTTISALSTQSPIATANKISPYTSFTEQWFLHGGTFTTDIHCWHLTPYYSQTKLDINLKDGAISSFDESGLHLEDSPTTTLKTTGLYSQWAIPSLQVGYNRCQFEFDKPFLDELKSQSYQVHSLDFRYQLGQTDYFGEFAQADEKNAKVVGLKTDHHNLCQTLIWRDFEKSFPTYLGKPITQTSSFDNQQGVYYGSLWKPQKKIKINFYLDLWKTPQTSSEADMPLSGQEILLRSQYSGKKHHLSLQYKAQKKEQLLSSDQIGDQETKDYKLEYHLSLGKFFKIKSRYNYRTFHEQEHKYGHLSFAELGFRHRLFSLISRAAYYKAKTPVYMYQQGVDGTMLTSAFSGEDLFYYFLANCQIIPHTKLQLKYSNYHQKKESQEITAQILLSKQF